MIVSPRERLALSGIMLSAITLIGSGTSASAHPADASGSERLAESRSADSALAAATAATAVFHDPAAALAAGYYSTEECVALPGRGVMGQHWYNFSRMTTDRSTLDPTRPQGLLYVPTADGPRLVGIEFLVLAPGAEPAADPTQVDPNGPELFGQHFNGLMPGHAMGMPTHWDLHVWIWQTNPAGIFAQYNTSQALSC